VDKKKNRICDSSRFYDLKRFFGIHLITYGSREKSSENSVNNIEECWIEKCVSWNLCALISDKRYILIETPSGH